jgi:glycosyltransferase involved in cell wall biosynthesis
MEADRDPPEDGPTLSIIVATIGRPTLTRTLASIASQLAPGDEVIVVRDASGDPGDTARMDAMPRARGTRLAFMDDDDVYAPDGLAKMRRFASEHPGRIAIFKMEHPVGTTHWRESEPELRYGNVSSQNFLVPNVPGRLGRWHELPRPSGKGNYAGDYVFIKETIELQGEPVFVDEVTARVRPIRNPLRLLWVRARYRAALGTHIRRLRRNT